MQYSSDADWENNSSVNIILSHAHQQDYVPPKVFDTILS